MAHNKLLVTGDVILDRQIYIANERNTFQQDTGGGAYLIYDLLRRIIAKANGVNAPGKDEIVKLGIEPFDVAKMRLRPDLHCFATYRMLKRTHKSDESDTVWRSSDALGYGSPMEGVKSPLGNVDGSATDSESTWLWVLDDANRGFRNGMANASGNALPAGSIWPIWNETLKPEWVVHKISGTLATGDLWRALAAGGNVMRALQEVAVVPSLADRLIAVVSIEALRAEGAFVSRGVSWEQILSAVVRWVTRFSKDQVLFNIRKARFVVVGCGAEGAIVIDNAQNDVRVVFDNCHTESEWTEKYPGSVFGRQSVLTAAVAAALRNKTLTSQSDSELFDVICHGVQAGIAGIRKLTEVGHGSKEDARNGVKPDWPMETVSDVVANHLQNRRFPGSDALGEFSAKLDSGFLQSQSDTWRMIDRPSTPSSGEKTQSTPQFGQARLIAQFGIRLGSLQVPYLEIGGLLSVDRREIESLRTIKHLVQNYEKLRSPKGPLCLGVFGQPGCGKSFGVKEVSRAFLSKDVPILEFNLSQFRSPDDLAAALHQVRDEVLQGRTPIVFWDEFDTSDNSWLRYLLAPMQDGKFRHGPLEHKIGKCVFVFAGGTSYDFDSFGPPDDWESAVQAGSVSAKVRAELRTRYTKERDEFVKAKGPDFKSRLNGFLDVAGPNQRKKFDWGKQRWQPDPTDIGFPIRRALLLRSLLGKKDDDQLDMDSGLLNALLLIDYHHGARSMEKLVEQMKARSNGEKLIRSHLPPTRSRRASTCDCASCGSRWRKAPTAASRPAWQRCWTSWNWHVGPNTGR